jgi:quinohemoprotein ethanol dehydrogenase
MRKLFVLFVAAGLAAAVLVALASAARGTAGAKKITPGAEAGYPWLPPGTTPAGTSTNNWQYPGGDLGQTNYSLLKQINTSNVSKLKIAWQASFDGPTYGGNIQGAPIVVSGKGKNLPLEGATMFLSANAGMLALNPLTGAVLWTYKGPPTVNGSAATFAGSSARTEAYGNGMVFSGQQDGSIVALNSKTGAPIWTAQVSGAGVFAGHSSLVSPATVFYDDGKDGLVFAGPNAGDAPMRGHLDAYNAKTGVLAWRWWTTPDPNQFPYILSWANPAEAALGGSATWSSFAVDPQLHNVYFGTGNVYPYTGRAAGKDLWSSSMIAADVETGALRWYYQTVHHDEWDYDLSNPPSVFRALVNGKRVPVVAFGGKNGYLYELNAKSGHPIFPIPEVPVPDLNGGKGAALNNTWPTQPEPQGAAGQLVPHCLTADFVSTALGGGPLIAPNGTPIIPTCPFAPSWYDAYYAWGPTYWGGVDYQRDSYSPQTNDFYVCSTTTMIAVENRSPTDWHQLTLGVQQQPTYGQSGNMSAVNMGTNKMDWQVHWNADKDGGCYSGVLSTAGGLVFVGSRGDGSRGAVATLPAGSAPWGGYLHAYDAKTGNELWSWQAPDYINAPPMTYVVNGKQYLAEYVMGPVPASPLSTGKRDLLTVFSL